MELNGTFIGQHLLDFTSSATIGKISVAHKWDRVLHRLKPLAVPDSTVLGIEDNSGYGYDFNVVQIITFLYKSKLHLHRH